MTYLLSYGFAGMGDFVSTIQFLRDFEQQRPDDLLLFRFEIPWMKSKYECYFDGNKYYHPYTSQSVDKYIHFGWGESKNDVEKYKLNSNCQYVYTDNLYRQFELESGVKIIKTNSKVDVFLTETEQNISINTNKKICILNIGYNILFGNSRNWGWSKFQELINRLHDKIQFIQVGDTQGGYYHYPLQNCINLINKSPIRTTLALIAKADYVLTHNSGTYHMASFDSDKRRRVIAILGGRDYYKFMDCYSPKNVEYSLLYNNNEYSRCYKNGNYCCDCGRVFSVGIPTGGNQIICSRPSYDIFGNVLCDCFNNISVDSVINEFLKK